MCFQVKASVSGWSLVQRRPTDCGVSECDREASTRRRRLSRQVGGGSALLGAVEPWWKKKYIDYVLYVFGG